MFDHKLKLTKTLKIPSPTVSAMQIPRVGPQIFSNVEFATDNTKLHNEYETEYIKSLFFNGRHGDGYSYTVFL